MLNMNERNHDCYARLGLLFLVVVVTFAAFAARATNYDESKAGSFTLPDPLVMKSGNTATSTNDWKDLRRDEIIKLYSGYIYGSSPSWRNVLDHKREMDPQALGGNVVRKQIDLEFYNYGPRTNDQTVTNLTLHVLLYTPVNTRPVATFLCLSPYPNYREVPDPNVLVYPVWDHKTGVLAMPTNIVRGDAPDAWPVQKILARGYGIAIVDCDDFEPNLADGSGWQYGVRSLYLPPGVTNFDANAWGAISAWAWGAACVMDYLQTDKEVDKSRIILVGHSQLGKAALWAAAQDTRFAMVIASCSGKMGASLAQRNYGDTVGTLCGQSLYQYCGNFGDYSNDVSDLPVDAHMLLSLIAPRPVFLSNGSQDRDNDPRGEFEAAVAASAVYHLFGEQSVITNLPPDVLTNNVNGSGSLLDSKTLESYSPPPPDQAIMNNIGFRTHTGGDTILPSDWDAFMDFADKRLPAQYWQ